MQHTQHGLNSKIRHTARARSSCSDHSVERHQEHPGLLLAALCTLVLIISIPTVGALLPGEHKYLGSKCQSQSNYPGGQCPITGACGVKEVKSLPGSISSHQGERTSACVQWRSGSFHPPLFDTKSTAENKHRDSSKQLLGSGSTSWLPQCNNTDIPGDTKKGGRWVAASSSKCQFRWLSQGQAYRCLATKRILISGDSMMRQLALRLVTHLRGLTAVIDHFFQSDFVYINNGTHDSFHVNQSKPGRNNSRTYLDGPLVEIIFRWSPHSTAVEAVRELQPDVSVIGIHYWSSDSCPWIAKSLESIANASSNTRVFWVDTPLRRAAPTELNKQLPLRNSLVHDHVLRVRETHNRSLYYLPFDLMSRHHLTYARVDHAHYTCRSVQQLDQQILGKIRTTVKADCVDLMNLNLLQMILGTACYT